MTNPAACIRHYIPHVLLSLGPSLSLQMVTWKTGFQGAFIALLMQGIDGEIDSEWH